MRMISRKQALEIVDAHGWKPDDCTVSHTAGDHLNIPQTECYCYQPASFNSDLGIHDQYAIIDIKHWLGY